MDTNRHWVGTWATSPAPSEAGVGFNNHTVRMNPRLSIGGDTLRVRVSNAYGNGNLAIGAAYVGIRDKGPAIVPGSERQLTFGGSTTATVAAGALVISDSVESPWRRWPTWRSRSTARRDPARLPDHRALCPADQLHLAARQFCRRRQYAGWQDHRRMVFCQRRRRAGVAETGGS